MKLEIVKMNKDNYNLAAQIGSRCLKEAWSEQTCFEQLSNPVDHTYIAFADGIAAGFLSLWFIAGEIEINNIAVDEKYRRRGVASALLKIIESDFPGAENAFLEVRESNAGAISLYENLGFSAVGIRKNFYSEPIENAVLMSKNLSK